MNSSTSNKGEKTNEAIRASEDSRHDPYFISSESSKPALDTEDAELALDRIHTTASRAENLTSFDEYAAPPRPVSGDTSKALAAELTHGGISGLYSKLKLSVTGTKEGNLGLSDDNVVNKSIDDRGRVEAARAKASKSSATTALTSTNLPSAPSSRISSPSIVRDGEGRVNAPPDDLVADATLTNKLVSAFSKSSIKSQEISGVNKGAGDSSNGSASKSSGSTSGKTAISGLVSKAQKSRNDDVKETSKLPRDQVSLSPNHTHFLESPKLRPASNDYPPQRIEARAAAAAAELPYEDMLKTRKNNDADIDDEQLSPESEVMISHANKAAIRKLAQNALAEDALDGEDLLLNAPMAEEKESSEEIIHADNKQKHLPSLFEHNLRSHLNSYSPSQASSLDGSRASPYSGDAMKYPIALASKLKSENIIKAFNASTVHKISDEPYKRKLLGREYWMKDENAKDCFYCGDSFSTFRRKHHCRKYIIFHNAFYLR